MFLKQFHFENQTKTIYYFIKRNYNIKKLSNQIEKNPHMKNFVDEQLKRREQKGILKKLVEKR